MLHVDYAYIYIYTGKRKANFHPRAEHEVPEGIRDIALRYRPNLSLTSALDESGWSAPRPGRFIPWKDPVSIV
jgi:hypothetical protein